MKSKLANTAAALTAASISEVFPGAELLGGGTTRTGFFYQFTYSRPFPPEALSMLQEHMRQIVRENRTHREMETVALSASVLFKRCGNERALETVEEMDGKEMVSVVQVGDFYDLMEGPFCPTIRDVGAFQIVSMKTVDGVIRLDGCVFARKDELKDFLKKLAAYKKKNHLNSNLWVYKDQKILWKATGLEARRKLIEFLREQFPGEALAGSEEAVDAYAKEKKLPFSATMVTEVTRDPEGDEGLFEEGCQSTFQQITYGAEKDLSELLISLLQSVEKTFIILGFQTELCLKGRKAESWCVKDALDRQHVVFRLKVSENRLQLKVGVEKILALLIELSDASHGTYRI